MLIFGLEIKTRRKERMHLWQWVNMMKRKMKKIYNYWTFDNFLIFLWINFLVFKHFILFFTFCFKLFVELFCKGGFCCSTSHLYNCWENKKKIILFPWKKKQWEIDVVFTPLIRTEFTLSPTFHHISILRA